MIAIWGEFSFEVYRDSTEAEQAWEAFDVKQEAVTFFTASGQVFSIEYVQGPQEKRIFPWLPVSAVDIGSFRLHLQPGDGGSATPLRGQIRDTEFVIELRRRILYVSQQPEVDAEVINSADLKTLIVIASFARPRS